MANDRDYVFEVKGKRFVFDGNAMSIYEQDSDAQAPKPPSADVPVGDGRGAYLRSLALNITNNCNLTCRYCYANQGAYDKPGSRMSLETARKSVDLVVESVARNAGEEFTVGFFGGEPLLEFDFIRQVVHYAESKSLSTVKPRFLVTTNGTLLTEECVDFFRNHNFQLMLSMDGSPESHDANRCSSDGKGSYVAAARGLRLALDRVPTTVRITLAHGNVDVDAAVGHLLGLGAKRLTYAMDYALDQGDFEACFDSVGRLFARYRTAISSGNYFDVTNVTEPIATIVLKQKKRAHCNAGVSYLSISADGEIHRCPRFTGNRVFALGSVSKLGRHDVAESAEGLKASLSDGVGQRVPSCTTCPFVFLCGGICYHHAHAVTGSEFGEVPRECAYRRKLFRYVLELLCDLTVQERRGFLLYLMQAWRKERR